ncbi:MAG: NGG1-interacting factor 3 [Frankiales bacterium]|nr:NGG1-interacting factor 3 [Frankiales bacterium]
MTTSLRDVVAALEGLYPPGLAEDWDAVGLVCGEPSAVVTRVLFAVDPVEAVVDEALTTGAQLLVTHHPLYLRGTSSVAADSAKGRVVHRLITGGCGLFVAHTNADRAEGGVNDALAALFDLVGTTPLDPGGLGRVGDLPQPMPLADLVARAAAVLPSTSWGVRGSGDPAAVVARLAVCGGAGDGALELAAASGAQAYLTADLRHHLVQEAPAGLALIDAAHWATEWPWLPVAAAALAKVVDVETTVSSTCTDPWTTAARSSGA